MDVFYPFLKDLLFIQKIYQIFNYIKMTKKCLVFETLGNINNLQVQESSNDNEVRLSGVFGVCGIKNGNNRIYDKENYGKMVESLQNVIATEGCPGELEHPNTMNIDLNNVSHKIESIEMNEDGTITGTILLLDTPKGQVAKAIIKGGLPLYISSRGAGNIDESGHVTLSTIKTYDLVGTPGFSQAKLKLKQNQTLECLNESLDEGNVCYAIVEGDDLLGGGGDDDKKDDDKKDDKKEEKKEEKHEEKSSDEKKDDEKKEDEKSCEDDDNNKNNEDNTTMNEIKTAIDKLTEKVTQLEAELHVAQESLEQKNSEIEQLTEKLNDIKEPNYGAIETWITEEFAPEFKAEILENTDKINESIDDYIINKYAPLFQSWITEEFAPEVQNWVCEEFAPEVQNWVCEEFAPEVQNWVCEEFAPEVQNWVCEEFAPTVEGWITEEFAPTVEGWITEEFAPEQENKINENVNEFMEAQKAAKLDDIDALLETLSSNEDAALKIMKEEKEKDKYAGVYVVENMPAQYKPLWNGLNESRQAEILRTSKVYDFTKEGVLESFWDNVTFTNEGDSSTQQVNENKDITGNYYNNVVAQMMRFRGA